MGHIDVKGLNSAVYGISSDNSTWPSCTICACTNIKHTPFPSNSNCCASCPLEHVHCDIARPLPHSYGNYLYYIVFVDCFSCNISLFFMRTRDKASSYLTEFRSCAENFTGERLTILHVDNAPELTHGKMEEICKTHGITFEKAIPHSPPTKWCR